MDASGMIFPPLLDSFSQSWYKETEVNAMKWSEVPGGIKFLLGMVAVLCIVSFIFLIWMAV
jgi:hypothetical protein